MSKAYIKQVKRGKAGLNVGIHGGLPRLDSLIGNVQLGKQITIVGNSGSGKTFFSIYRHIISPIEGGEENIKIFFWSLEMSEEDLVGRIISYYLYKDYGIRMGIKEQFSYGDYELSEDKLEKIQLVYTKYVIKILSKLTIINDRGVSNPTGIYKQMKAYAEDNGEIIYEDYNTTDASNNSIVNQRMVGYKANDPDHKVICIIDHLGLLKRERGFTKKQNIDKWVDDYAITLTKLFKQVVVNISQLNRTISTVERLKFANKSQKNGLEPQTSDIQDSSSVEQSSDIIFALFNPNMFSSITEHRGYTVDHWNGRYRSLHVIKSRYTPFPLNSCLYFDAKSCRFVELPDPQDAVAIQKFKQKYNI